MDTGLPDKRIVNPLDIPGDPKIYGLKGDRLYIRLKSTIKIGFGGS